MNIGKKKLTPELCADFFDFFNNRAFTDDYPYRCYCQVYQMSKKEYQRILRLVSTSLTNVQILILVSFYL